MKAHSVAPVRLGILALLAALSLALLIPTNAFPDNTPAPGMMPDVLILIDARNLNTNSVSVTYSRLVKKEDALRDLQQLLLDTQWTATGINISSEGGALPSTGVEFVTGSTVDWQTGNIPIEPIIKAYRNNTNIRLIYLVPQGFPFDAIGDYENIYVKITLQRGTDNYSYNYGILVKDPNFQNLGLPASQPRGQTGVQPKSRAGGMAIVLVVILAVVTAVLAYIVTDRLNRRGGQRSS